MKNRYKKIMSIHRRHGVKRGISERAEIYAKWMPADDEMQRAEAITRDIYAHWGNFNEQLNANITHWQYINLFLE